MRAFRAPLFRRFLWLPDRGCARQLEFGVDRRRKFAQRYLAVFQEEEGVRRSAPESQFVGSSDIVNVNGGPAVFAWPNVAGASVTQCRCDDARQLDALFAEAASSPVNKAGAQHARADAHMSGAKHFPVNFAAAEFLPPNGPRGVLIEDVR